MHRIYAAELFTIISFCYLCEVQYYWAIALISFLLIKSGNGRFVGSLYKLATGGANIFN